MRSGVPYLDLELVRFSFALPTSLKQRGKTNKYALREVAKRYLPPSIAKAPKTGFLFPLSHWLKDPLNGYLKDFLSEENLKKQGFWNTKEVRDYYSRFESGVEKNPFPIWNLFVLQAFLSLNN